MRKCQIVLLFIVLAHTGLAQNLDSLRGVWKNEALHDTIRLEAFNKLIWSGYMFSQPDSAFLLAEQLASEATKKNQPEYVARSLSLQGVSWGVRGDMRKGSELFLASAAMYGKAGEKRGQCNVLGNAGAALIELGEYERALDTYREIQLITTEIKDSVALARAYNGSGRVYALKGDVARATEYLDRGLHLAELIHDDRSISTALGHLANLSGEQEDFPRARTLFERVLDLSKKTGDTQNQIRALGNLGGVCFGLQDYDKAIEYHTQALDLCKAVGNVQSEGGELLGMARALGKLGEYAKGLERVDSCIATSEKTGNKPVLSRALSTKCDLQVHLGDARGAVRTGERAMALATELGGALEKKDAAENLFKAYQAVGDENNALRMHVQFTDLKDSLSSQANKRALLRQEYRYDYEKMALADSIAEADKTLLADLRFQEELGRERSNRNIIIVASAVVLALLLLLGYTIMKRRQQERKLAAIEMERLHQENVIGELRVREQVGRDIHDDMGAGLSALKLRSEMALETEPDPAKRIHFADQATIADELMGSMRQIIWAMNGEQSNVEDLVLYTAAYARNYCAQNNVALEVANAGPWPMVELSADQRRNLFLVVKEALHNMVKHAGAHRANLRMEWSDGLTVEVADNGKGLSLVNDRPKGNGLQNMEKRVSTLGGELTIDGSQGTCIRFHVPLLVGEGNKSSVASPVS